MYFSYSVVDLIRLVCFFFLTELLYFNPLVKLTSTLTFFLLLLKKLLRNDQKLVDLFLTEVRPLGVMGKGITIELEWILVTIIAATEGNS